MNLTLSQEDIDIYATSDQAPKEIPGSPYYRDGVEVGFKAPAKWFNWMFNKITTLLTELKADKHSINTELGYTISSASITADASNTHQLSKAVDVKSLDVVVGYVEEEVTEEVEGQTVTHLKNRPFVVGSKLFLPDTELN